MADGDFLSGLLNLPGQALNGIGGLLSSVGNGLGDATNAGATDASSVLSRFLPSSGQASGMFSDPMRMALLQAGIGASQPSTTRAGVWGNMASGFGQGLLNSQDQMLKRQLLAGEVQKQNMANLSQIAPLVQAGILPQQAMTQALNRAGLGQAPVPGAPSPQGASVPGQAGSSGGAPGGITSAPLPAPPGAQSPQYGAQAQAQPAGAPSVPNANVAGAAAPQVPSVQMMAQTLGVPVPYTAAGQDKLREDFVAHNEAIAKQQREQAAAGPVEFDKESAKADLTQAAALAGGRELGRKILATNNGVRQVLDAMSPSDFGPQGMLTAGAANALQGAGFDTSRPKREILEALQNRMKEQALAGINNDRLSESEGKGSRAIPPEMATAIDKSIGSMDLSKKGLQGLADIADQAANQLVRRGDFVEKYRDQNNGRWDYKGQGRLDREVDQPFKVDVAKQFAGNSQSAAPQGMPAGTPSKTINGKTYFNVNGQWYGAQ